MRKLPAVEDAKALMRESQDWGVFRWLMEKRRVRAAADAAWEALGEAEKKVKSAWSDDLKRAYDDLAEESKAAESKPNKRRKHEPEKFVPRVDPEMRLTAKRVKEADDEAYRAHMDAEDIFAEAEKRLSTSMAKQGAERAVEAWELTEKAIRKAEAAGRSSESTSAES